MDMNEALLRLARDGSAGGRAIDTLRERWRDGAGSLTPERVAADPALQADPLVSFTRSSGSLQGALAAYHETQRRMTLEGLAQVGGRRRVSDRLTPKDPTR